MYVAIAGNIGSGKTTLTEMLTRRYGAKAYYEETDNPYIGDFYNDMSRWAFHLQISFRGSRIRQTLDMLAHRGYSGKKFFLAHLSQRHIGGQKIRIPPQHCQRCAQIVRKGGVQAFTLLHHSPHLPIVFFQRLAHGFKEVHSAPNSSGFCGPMVKSRSLWAIFSAPFCSVISDFFNFTR